MPTGTCHYFTIPKRYGDEEKGMNTVPEKHRKNPARSETILHMTNVKKTIQGAAIPKP